MIRTCLRCGKQLPPTSSQSRRYCDECGIERNKELTRERQRKAAQRMAEANAIRHYSEDREYCKVCLFYGSETYGNNLCDYILKTGHKRGCKAGVGCVKRKIAQE